MTTPKLGFVLSVLPCGMLLLMVGVASAQSNMLPVPLEVRPEVAQTVEANKPFTVFVTLHNQSPSAQLTNVVVTVGSYGMAELQGDTFDLQPGQTRVVRLDVAATESNPYVLTSFRWNNQEHSLATTVTRPVSAASLWPMLLPVISTLVGGILGAWLVNSFTGHRERARANFEWSKMLFEKYEAAFRGFLRGWQDLSSAVSLKTEFDNLIRDSYVPLRIRENYAVAMAALSDAARSNDQKRQAGEEFRDIVESFMKGPSYS